MPDSQSPEPFEYLTLDEADTNSHWAAIRMDARELQIPASFTCAVMLTEDDQPTGMLLEFHRLEGSVVDAHCVTMDMETCRVLHMQLGAALRNHP